MVTESTLGSALELFIVLPDILQEILTKLFCLLDVIRIRTPNAG